MPGSIQGRELNFVDFKCLRNRVNRERNCIVCRAKYYEASVEHLRTCKLNIWWKEALWDEVPEMEQPRQPDFAEEY